jgi:hypothetical protein
MTGTTVTRGLVVGTTEPGMATTGSTTVGMASGGTVGATSGPRTAMTGTTAAMPTVVGTAGLGTRPITAGFTTVGMATSGTVGKYLRHEHRVIRHLRAWPARSRAGSAGQARPTAAAVTAQCFPAAARERLTA